MKFFTKAKVEMFFQGKNSFVGTQKKTKKGNLYSKMPFLNPRPPKK